MVIRIPVVSMYASRRYKGTLHFAVNSVGHDPITLSSMLQHSYRYKLYYRGTEFAEANLRKLTVIAIT